MTLLPRSIPVDLNSALTRSRSAAWFGASILAIFLALLPRPAQAGVGFTAGGYSYTDGTSFVPSLDYRVSGVLIQLHLLDLLAGPATTGAFALNTGADISYSVIHKKCAPEVEGVFMPGVGFRVADTGANTGFNAMAKVRFGAEMKKGIGFGMYVVPAVGISNITSGTIRANYGGGIEVSAWFVEGKQ